MPFALNFVPEEAVTITLSGKRAIRDDWNPECRATCTKPKWDLLDADPEGPLAIDSEFQEHRAKDAPKWSHRMGRFAVVNSKGQVIYDTYVRYPYDAHIFTKMPPPVFGVTRKDLKKENGAQPSKVVEDNLKKMFKGRVIVGHGMRLDRIAVGKVLQEDHVIRDTQHIYGQRALWKVAGELLDESFTFHNPVEDARATMAIYLLQNPYKGRIDFHEPPPEMKDMAEYPALGSKL